MADNSLTDPLLLPDDTALKLGTDGDFEADFDSASGNLTVKKADGTVLATLTPAGLLTILGDLMPVTHNSKNLGSADVRWANAYSVNGSVSQDLTIGDDLSVADQISIGTTGVTRATILMTSGAGGNTPAYIRLCSPNGTNWWLFVEDDGTLKVHTGPPAANTDGTVVGSQT